MRLNEGFNVPTGWDALSLKRIARFGYGDALASDDREPGDVKVFGSNGAFDTHSKANTLSPCIIVDRKGSYGKLQYSEEPVFAVDTTFIIDRRYTTVHLRYLYYMIGVLGLDELSDDTAVPGLSRAKAYQALCPVPPFAIQERITDFLDERTTRIDGLIAKKTRLLELLTEQRQALITRAVTKGLDPSAPMKPSGIDWLGDIPADWEVKRVWFDCKINPKKSEVNAVPETEVSFIPMEAIGELGGLDLDQVRTLDEVYEGYTYLADGDVCVAKITPCFENGKGALASSLSNGLGFGTTELHVLRAKTNLSTRFLFYLSISQPFRAWGAAEMLGAGGQKRVPENFFKDWPLAKPKLEQQEHVADFLDKQTAQIDHTATKVRASIGLLQEYRAALITAAVTGKIETRLPAAVTQPAARQAPAAFKRAVLAAHIADRMCDQATFGKVKFQKTLHLAEAHLGIDEVEGQYYRKAAGPFDPGMMRSVHSQFKKQGWITPEEREGNKGTQYRRGVKIDAYKTYFDRYFGDKKEAIDGLLTVMKPMKTKQAEIVSTCFAAWNDLLIRRPGPVRR